MLWHNMLCRTLAWSMEKDIRIHYNNGKVRTGINGLDELLYGGLQLQTVTYQRKGVETSDIRPLTISIVGDTGTSRSMLAMQLLHGITKSLMAMKTGCETSEGFIRLGSPVFFSSHDKLNLSDMLIDMTISKCVNKVIEDNAYCDTGEEVWGRDRFCRRVFSVSDSDDSNIELDKLDCYLGKEIAEYNIMTNSLEIHYCNNGNPECSEKKCLSFRRKADDLGKYRLRAEEEKDTDIKELFDEFFDVKIKSFEEEVADDNNGVVIPCVVFDRDRSMENGDNPEKTGRYRDKIKKIEKQKAFVRIYINDRNTSTDGYDMIIDMRNYTEPELRYMSHQLSIHKCSLQDAAKGWHQYKKRNAGIEVYPSVHVILQRRNHMPKDVLRAAQGILSETYQRYVERSTYRKESGIASLNDFIDKETVFKYKKNKLWQLYRNYANPDSTETVIENILTGSNDGYCQVTAIIGLPNTFKRHLALAGTFSASCRGEHTLNILIGNDDDRIFRKMICPAAIFRNPEKTVESKCCKCMECYECIHFKEIRTGCITSDELFYYLTHQIKLSSKNESKRIRRIVIDDLQKIEFCFPLLHKDPLFLPSLISICKVHGVDLFILCDRTSELAESLRAQADNVVLTERTSENYLNIFVERYDGYSYPSRMWGCEVLDVKDLFYCDIDHDRNGRETKYYSLNRRRTRSIQVYSLEDVWNRK